MIRGTTPTINITLNGITISDTDKIEITIEQDDNEKARMVKGNDDVEIDNSSISFSLTQEETFNFKSEKGCYIQVRIKNAKDEVYASNITRMFIDESLSEVVL